MTLWLKGFGIWLIILSIGVSIFFGMIWAYTFFFPGFVALGVVVAAAVFATAYWLDNN